MANNDGSLNFDTKIDSSGFQKGVDSLGGVASKGVAATTKVLGGVATGLGALGGAAIKVGSDFEAGMSQVQAVSGASAEDLEKLKEKAKEMGATTKFSATESAEALNYMAMAGWKTEDMLGGIEGIMNLAAASGSDLATTSDIVTDALTAFGMSANESTHFADILAAASSNANTNVEMMGETFKYVAPLAGSLGYSAEDTATAIGLMANAGIKGSQAGTSLRSIMTRMAKPTKESATAMNALGLSITDAKGNMKPLSALVDDMRKGFAGLTEDEKATYAAMLGGQEAMSGLLAIVNASDADFKKLSGAIDNCNGSAQEMAEIMQDNLQGQITILQSGLEGLGVSIYETMQDMGKGVVQEAQNMVQQLRDAFNEDGFSGLVTAFGDVLSQIVEEVAGAAPSLIEAASNLISSFCDSIRSSVTLGDSGAELITSLVTGLANSADELWVTAIVLIGKLADGLAAGAPQMIESMGTALMDTVECISDWLPDIMLAGTDIILSLLNGITSGIPTMIPMIASIGSTIFSTLAAALPQITQAGVELMNTLAEGISSNLPAMIPAAMNALMEFSGSLRENVGQLVDAGLNLIMTLAQSLIDNIPVFIETIPTIVTNIAGIINDNAPKLLACGIELIGKLVMGLVQAIPTLIENIPQIIQAIVSVFTAFNWVSLGSNIITFIKNGISSLATAIPNAMKTIGENAKNFLRNIDWHSLGSNIITFIVNGVQSLVTAIPTALKTIGHTAVEMFKAIDWIDLGANVIKGIIAGITGALDGLWSAVGDVCSGMLDKVKGFFGIHSPSTVMAEQGDYLVQGLVDGLAGMPDEIAQYLDQTVAEITAWGQQMLAATQQAATTTINGAVAMFQTLPAKVQVWLVAVVTRITAWGQQMLAAARTAIQNMISAIISLMSQLPGKVWTWLVAVVTKVNAWGQQMVAAARTAISNMISAIISLLSTLPGKVQSELAKVTAIVNSWGSSITSQMREIGVHMVEGLYEGMSSKWSWLEDQVKKMADDLVEKTKEELKVNSPSKRFNKEIGRWLMPGTMQGVKDSMPQTLREMKAHAGELLDTMRGAVSASMNNVSMSASGAAAMRYMGSTGTTVYNDNRMSQENNYNVPVASPSETAKKQREAFRNFAGGVK